MSNIKRNLFRPRLSSTPTGRRWTEHFGLADRADAAALLDAMLLLDDGEAAEAVREGLDDLASSLPSKTRVALYAEREYATNTIYQVSNVPDATGRVRRRALGKKGPAAVAPVRGSTRVGSEGAVASWISQAVGANRKIFLNHPGPDRLRSQTRRLHVIAVVSDFIGSGTRICTMLDKFWAVPSVRSWVSLELVSFAVVAAAGTPGGMSALREHRLSPSLFVKHVAPQVETTGTRAQRQAWQRLVSTYSKAGSAAKGYKDSGALVAFSWGMPNNVPAILSEGGKGLPPLFSGRAPVDMRRAFGIREPEEMLATAAEAVGVKLAIDLRPDDGLLAVFLASIRGRWRPGATTELAERLSLPEPDIRNLADRSLQQGLLSSDGHLTESGQKTIGAARKCERRAPEIATNPEPYYPKQLRVSRRRSSSGRPSGRP